MHTTTRLLGPDDAAATAALMARIDADHPTGFCLSADEVVEVMEHLPGSLVLGAEDDEELVGYAVVLGGQPHDSGQRMTLFGDVDPTRLGEGIGSLLLVEALRRAREVHAEQAPHLPARYASQALAGRDDQADLLRSVGMEPGRHAFLMRAELRGTAVDLPVPSGLTVTAFDPADAEELRAAHNDAFADYPDGSPADADYWQAFMVRATHARHELSVVARDEGGRVAGYVFAHEYAVPMSPGPGREAYVPFVGTLPEHRGRGLATALLAGVLARCRAAGYDRVTLNVDTANPTGALGIYERAGFAEVYRQDFYRLDEPAAG
ncbi:GNAT family N-acetyltransferase [Nocardioides okcheonensis]|uniref:GNAT family N-acetyltransferase n=1 Tax=Nocardioides okcheonensis TaxID=2894081 RepID=UPI001E3A64DD|nr:GNAT family N-acetyltransferase [Nocardioides okcheonensis]UFN45281.1 GNAT family N-acetyltransferase [Nocardioides okcheonensis]